MFGEVGQRRFIYVFILFFILYVIFPGLFVLSYSVHARRHTHAHMYMVIHFMHFGCPLSDISTFIHPTASHGSRASAHPVGIPGWLVSSPRTDSQCTRARTGLPIEVALRTSAWPDKRYDSCGIARRHALGTRHQTNLGGNWSDGSSQLTNNRQSSDLTSVNTT